MKSQDLMNNPGLETDCVEQETNPKHFSSITRKGMY